MKKTLLAVALGALIAGPAMANQDPNAGDKEWPELYWQAIANKSADTQGGISIATKGDVNFGNKKYGDGEFTISIVKGITFKKDLEIKAKFGTKASAVSSTSTPNARMMITKADFTGQSTVELDSATQGTDGVTLYKKDGGVDVYNWENSLAGDNIPATNKIRFYLTKFYIGQDDNNTYDTMPSGDYTGDIYMTFRANWAAGAP